jgi:hypothetical protein
VRGSSRRRKTRDLTRDAADTQALVADVLASCPELPLPDGLADRVSAAIDREAADPASADSHPQKKTTPHLV